MIYSPSFDQTIFHVTPRDLLHINRSFSSCPKAMFWKEACAKPSIRKWFFYSHPNISHFYRKVFEIEASALSSYQIGKGSSPSVDILFSILSHNRLGLPPPKILHNLLFSEALVMTAYSKEHLATYAKFWDKQHVLLWIKKIVNVDQFVGLRPYFERSVFRTLRKFDQKC